MTNDVSIMADIGGTNTRIALATGTHVQPDSIQRFKNVEYSGLEAVLSEYLSTRPGVSPSAACAAIAGPVKNGFGTLTNLDWSVDKELLHRATSAKITSVINDLQAQGHALEHLPEGRTKTIATAQTSDAYAARLVVGVGTGFNAAAVYRTGVETLAPPAEAGHIDLPTPNTEMRAFADYFTDQNGFCSVEDMISGRGLSHIYRWLIEAEKSPADIMESHQNGSDAKASETVAIFSRALGSVCGNLALNVLPFGGIYLVGGVSLSLPIFRIAGLSKHSAPRAGFLTLWSNSPSTLSKTIMLH